MNTLRKICFRKCKNCKGPACPNYFGKIDKKAYYTGVLHATKIRFADDVVDKKLPMDNFDKSLIWFLIITIFTLLLIGGLLS